MFDYYFAPCKGIRILAPEIPKSGKILLVVSGIQGFGNQNRVQVLRDPNKAWNPESTFHWKRLESSTRNPQSTELDSQSKTVLYSLTWGNTRENKLRERIPHTWPSSHENYFHSILGSVSYCVVILRTPPYWSVRVASCNFKLGG